MEEKRNHDYTTVFICFLKSGLYFTRDDTNAVGLQFMDEMRKHNPDFKPKKVQQREFKNTFTVNAFPKEFEPLIMTAIEERRKSHNLQPRPKKRPGFNKFKGGQRQGYQSRDNRYTSSHDPRYSPPGRSSGGPGTGGEERRTRRRRIIRPANPDNNRNPGNSDNTDETPK